MCDRYSCVISKDQILPGASIKIENQQMLGQCNISPGNQAAVIIKTGEVFRAVPMLWGLIPYFSKRRNTSHSLYNARIEVLPTSMSFRMPIRRNKCLIPADSYYVWKSDGKGVQPYRVMSTVSPVLYFAGIWDTWSDGIEKILSFTIISKPGESDEPERFPAYFTNLKNAISWMQSKDLSYTMDSLRQLEETNLKRYKVTRKAANPAYRSQDIHQELIETPGLFS